MTRQSIVSRGTRTGLSVRLLAHSGSPRAYALAMTRWGNDALAMTTHTLSLRGGSGASDAAIHRVLGDAGGVVCSLTGSQWIVTGFALAMTSMRKGHDDRVRGACDDNTLFVIARRTAGRRGNPSCLGGMRTTCLFVYWFTMDRPRLSAPAMTRVS